MIYFLSLRDDTPKRGFWDYGLLEDLLKLDKNEYKEVSEIPQTKTADFAIVVVPARSHAELVKEINREIGKLYSVLLILMGDEESVFPVDEVKHDRIKIWVQNARRSLHDQHRRIGTGYPPQLKEHMGLSVPDKKLDWFFAGQVTHERREQMVDELKAMNDDKGYYYPTEGFTQGLDHDEYYRNLKGAKIALCPSGPETPDTFRLFEALESGTLPIADCYVPSNKDNSDFGPEFWTWLFEESPPFPQIKDWQSLPGYLENVLANWKHLSNRTTAWWIQYKRKLKYRLTDDVVELTGHSHRKVSGVDAITAVIPVSPIPSHPDTAILEETVKSIQHHLPEAEILITFDGVRDEQESRRADYEENIRRILWKCLRQWENVTPFIFDDHLHQVGMAREVLPEIKSPLLLYVEQDTPIVTDEPIDWNLVKVSVIGGESNMIRFHHEAHVPAEHDFMMIGKPGQFEKDLLRTAQWSQRPHVASVLFYERILKSHFSPGANCFIEDKMHSVLHEAYLKHGPTGWNEYRTHIYHPEGQIKRSYHTDGRQGAEKYDGKQVF